MCHIIIHICIRLYVFIANIILQLTWVPQKLSPQFPHSWVENCNETGQIWEGWRAIYSQNDSSHVTSPENPKTTFAPYVKCDHHKTPQKWSKIRLGNANILCTSSKTRFLLLDSFQGKAEPKLPKCQSGKSLRQRGRERQHWISN